ncbi:DUF2971 domain-containing protein [Phyllobacterium sp. YR531]|uniref:DUF2971 domain-containing protein n=1 Tax=Phyllobacterium sp. YR531 TaxID=1144343 RepID=UPI00026F52AB|nr:DUF2971 domain-containing protein [Phyllobacterium sp. YR531]EJN02480.1 hypothetical protein PMI41_03232 [Phyllobacterium sp. YR531]
MENWDPAVVKLLSIFMPSAFKSRAAITQESRFVHYTTSTNLLKILDRGEIEFRNTSDMNDHQDVEVGIERLHQWITHPDSKALVNAIDHCAPGVWAEGVKKFDEWLPKLKNETYVVSVSQHNPSENNTGRLSLWRAFDKNAVGVAVVVHTSPFMHVAEALKAYSSPVTYWTRQEFFEEFEVVAASVLANRHFLSRTNRVVLREVIFLMLLFAAICSKHPGLRDEQEWRVLTNPFLWPTELLFKQTTGLKRDGRAVYNLALKDRPAEGIVGLEFPQLISRIIIGPAQNSEAVRQEIISKLTEKGVSQPATKVVLSKLPWRHKAMG